MIFIKKRYHQVFPLGQQQAQRDKANDCQLQRVMGCDCQDIAHGNRLNAHRHWGQRDHEQPQTEKRSENQPDNRVFFQTRALVEKQHRARSQAASGKRPKGKRQAQHIGPGHPGNDRMA